jgi:hypothetical protein
MPIQTLSGTTSRLISQFTRTIIFLMLTLRRISPRWSSSLNSSWRKHLTHLVTPTPRAEKIRFENDSDVSRLNIGQLCSYAVAHAGLQFCVHAFTLFVCGRSARFIRWDRAGATVTRSFDYIKEPHILANFFWRYAHLNHSQRGYDTSVSPASPEDLQQIQHVEQCLRDENPAHREFRIIMVPDNPEVETPFII